VYIRRATTLSIMTNASVESEQHNPHLLTPSMASKSSTQAECVSLLSERSSSPLPPGDSSSCPLLQQQANEREEERMGECGEGATGHDLIPYTGRLLSASIAFTYEADVEGPGGEVLFPT